MIKTIRDLENSFSISKAAVIVGFFTLLSRLVGLLRDQMFARKFGAGDTLDVYYAAFRLPDFIFNLFILGTLSVAFIPIFSEWLAKDRQKAYNIANTVLNTSVLMMLILCAILFVFIHPLTKLLVPGFSPEKYSQTVLLSRIFLASPIIFTISNVFGSMLHAQKKFLMVSAAPVFYNFGVIFGLVFLYPRYNLTGLGLGVIFGALMHLLIQAIENVRMGFSWQAVLNFQEAAVKKIAKLFLPRIIGLDISQISLLISSIVGSVLASGSIAIYNLSTNLNAVPTGVFAIALAAAAFPLLCEEFSQNNDQAYTKTLGQTMVQILFFLIPLSILMLLLRAHIVRLAFGYGKFDWQDTKLTFTALGVLSLSLFSQGLTPLLARAFYARQNTIIPVLVNLVSIALNALLAVFLGRKFGVVGIAGAFSIASVLNGLALFLLLYRRIAKAQTDQGQLMKQFDGYLFKSILKIVFASLLMGITSYVTLYVIEPFVNTHKVFGLFFQAGWASISGLTVFFWICHWLGVEQVKNLIAFFKNRFQVDESK